MNTAEIVRDLLAAGGVVAVKLAQMIAEDPKVGVEYRQLLGYSARCSTDICAREGEDVYTMVFKDGHSHVND
jgi:hypothetical protein